MVEAAGIEPASEDRSMQVSTCVVCGIGPVLRAPRGPDQRRTRPLISPAISRRSPPAILQ